MAGKRGEKRAVHHAKEQWTTGAVALKRNTKRCTPEAVVAALEDRKCCTVTTSDNVLDVVMPYVCALYDENRRLTAELQTTQFKAYLAYHNHLVRVDSKSFYVRWDADIVVPVVLARNKFVDNALLAGVVTKLEKFVGEREGAQQGTPTDDMRCGICTRWFCLKDKIAFPESGAPLIFHEICLARYIFGTANKNGPFFVFPTVEGSEKHVVHAAYYAGIYYPDNVAKAISGSDSLAAVRSVAVQRGDSPPPSPPRDEDAMDVEQPDAISDAVVVARAEMPEASTSASDGVEAAPICPTPGCGATRVLRNGPTGPFWGCPNYKKLNCKPISLAGRSTGSEPTLVIYKGSRLLLLDEGAPMTECKVRRCIKRNSKDKSLFYACPKWAPNECKCGIISLDQTWKCPRGNVLFNKEGDVIGPVEAPDVSWPKCNVCKNGMYARFVKGKYMLECPGNCPC